MEDGRWKMEARRWRLGVGRQKVDGWKGIWEDGEVPRSNCKFLMLNFELINPITP